MEQRELVISNVILLAWLGLACGMMVLPAATSQQLKSLLRDVSSIGLTQVQKCRGLFPEAWLIPSVNSSRKNSVDQAVADNDRLQREIVSLKDQLAKQRQQQWQARQTASLFQPELIVARELLPEQQTRWRQSRWLDAGSKKNVSEQNWILKSELPVIDLGKDFGIENDHLLLSGRQILGQIDQVGLWSSTYRPVTHEQFRCPALVMNAQTGLRDENSAGSLHGVGQETCELKYIENTHPVNVGDLVVLADPERRFHVPLILGTVTAAKVLTNSPFWEIQVTPVINEQHSRQVHVLGERLNFSRLLKN